MHKRLILLLSTATLFLCIPLIAMQFSNDIQWDLLDFAVAGGLLYGAAIGIEFIFRISRQPGTFYALVILLLVLLALLWAEMAVGIFGTPLAGS